MGKCIINNKECIWVKTVLLSYLQGEGSKIICNCAVCSDETTLLPGYIGLTEWLPGPEPGVPGGGHIYSYLYHILIYLYYLCLPLQVWQPADEPPIYNQECEVYDGSLIPDCDYFLNNYTSYYHVHEYSETCWHCRGAEGHWSANLQTAASSGSAAPPAPASWSAPPVTADPCAQTASCTSTAGYKPPSPLYRPSPSIFV